MKQSDSISAHTDIFTKWLVCTLVATNNIPRLLLEGASPDGASSKTILFTGVGFLLLCYIVLFPTNRQPLKSLARPVPEGRSFYRKAYLVGASICSLIALSYIYDSIRMIEVPSSVVAVNTALLGVPLVGFYLGLKIEKRDTKSGSGATSDTANT